LLFIGENSSKSECGPCKALCHEHLKVPSRGPRAEADADAEEEQWEIHVGKLPRSATSALAGMRLATSTDGNPHGSRTLLMLLACRQVSAEMREYATADASLVHTRRVVCRVCEPPHVAHAQPLGELGDTRPPALYRVKSTIAAGFSVDGWVYEPEKRGVRWWRL
jgi:hypothetical protein